MRGWIIQSAHVQAPNLRRPVERGALALGGPYGDHSSPFEPHALDYFRNPDSDRAALPELSGGDLPHPGRTAGARHPSIAVGGRPSSCGWEFVSCGEDWIRLIRARGVEALSL